MSNKTSFQKLHDEAIANVMEEAKATMRELEPAVKRYNEAMAYLGSQHEKPKASTKRRSSAKKRRSRAGGTHGDRLVKVLAKEPGISPTDLAKKLGMSNPAYAYTVLRNEVDRGTIRKVGRGKYEVVSEESKPSSPEPETHETQETQEQEQPVFG
jgi:ribosomal protein S25